MKISFRFLLCGPLLLFGLGGCGTPDSLLETPIWKQNPPQNLLAKTYLGPDASQLPEGVSKLRADHLVARVEIAANATLILDGRLARQEGSAARPPTDSDLGSRDPASRGPAEFIVEINGKTVLRHELISENDLDTFTESLSLSPWQGQKADFDFRIRNPEPAQAEAYWRRIQLQIPEPIPRRPTSAGPNLLLVVVDTLRADHTSLYGYERDTTPFLEQLGAESLVFEHAIAPASWTLPAMASILTGMYPPRHGTIQGGGGLRQSFTTLSEIAQEAGLTTVGISANPLISAALGFDQGFEEFHDLAWRRAPAVNQSFTSWLEGKDDLQWFAYLHYIDPHDPYDAPPPHGQRYIDPGYDGAFTDPEALIELYFSQNYGLEPPLAFDDRDRQYLTDAYDGEIHFWDQHLGQLIEHLRAAEQLDRTIVIVLSDHGEEFLEHEKLKHGHSLYQQAVRVPLVIRYPRLGQGRRSQPVETRAVFHTALRLLGLAETPKRGDLLTPESDSPRPLFSHLRYPVVPNQVLPREVMATIRQGDWKLIHSLDRDRIELYHLGQDPREQTDLAAEHPDIVEPMRQDLATWLSTQTPKTDEKPAQIDAETLSKLRALGYVQ